MDNLKTAGELTKDPEVFFTEEDEVSSLNKPVLCTEESARVAFVSLFPELRNKSLPKK